MAGIKGQKWESTHKVYVDFKEVIALESLEGFRTKIFLRGGCFIVVDKSFDEVSKKLFECLNKK